MTIASASKIGKSGITGSALPPSPVRTRPDLHTSRRFAAGIEPGKRRPCKRPFALIALPAGTRARPLPLARSGRRDTPEKPAHLEEENDA